MSARPTPRPRRQAGFTLVECIIVIVVLGIASIGIAKVQGRIFSGQDSLKDLQVRTRLMEECAEQVMAVREHMTDGYAEVSTTAVSPAVARFGTNLCDTVPAFGSYAIPSVTVTDYIGSLCAANTTCKTVSISHAGMTPLTILLVDY